MYFVLFIALFIAILYYSFNTNSISKLIKFIFKKTSNLLCFSFSSLWCMIKNIVPLKMKLIWSQKLEKKKKKKEEMLVIASIFKIWAGKTWNILQYFLLIAVISCNTDLCSLPGQEWLKGLCNYESSFLKLARPSPVQSNIWLTSLLVIWKTAASQHHHPTGASLLRCREQW